MEALTRAGRLDQARHTFEKMLTYANHLGLYSEEIGPSGEALGNFPQAFTHLGLIRAAVKLDRALAVPGQVTMSGPPAREAAPPGTGRGSRCTPGRAWSTGAGDTLLVVPVLPASAARAGPGAARRCATARIPTGPPGSDALRALLDRRSAGRAARTSRCWSAAGRALRVLVHGPVRILVDGHAPAGAARDDGPLVEHVSRTAHGTR